MRGNANTTGVEMSGGFVPVPEDKYLAKIVRCEGTHSSAGDPMVNTMLLFNHEGREYKAYDRIVISENENSKGYKILGRSKHFLHCINEQYEGAFTWDSDNWINKIVGIEMKHNFYISKKDGREKIGYGVGNYYAAGEKGLADGTTMSEPVNNKPVPDLVSDPNEDSIPF